MEHKFQEQQCQHISKLFMTSLFLKIAFVIMMLVFTLVRKRSNIDHSVLFALTAFVLILIRLFGAKISDKYPRFFKCMTKFFFIVFGLVLTEFFRTLKDDFGLEKPGTFTFLIPIQTYYTMLIVSNLSWYFSSLTYLLNILYFIARIFDDLEFMDSSLMRAAVLMGMVYFTFMAYKNEKTYRQLFKSNYESHESLNVFHLLLKDVIPSAICILDYGEEIVPRMQFINDPGMKILDRDIGKHCEESPFEKKFEGNEQKLIEKENEDGYRNLLRFLEDVEIVNREFLQYSSKIDQFLLDYYKNKLASVDLQRRNTLFEDEKSPPVKNSGFLNITIRQKMKKVTFKFIKNA